MPDKSNQREARRKPKGPATELIDDLIDDREVKQPPGKPKLAFSFFGNNDYGENDEDETR